MIDDHFDALDHALPLEALDRLSAHELMQLLGADCATVGEYTWLAIRGDVPELD